MEQLDSLEKKIVEDDKSYILDIKHIIGPWNQYDFLLDTCGYGWEYILDSADYMCKADLLNIGTISVSSSIGSQANEYISEYNAASKEIKNVDLLKNEGSMLGLGGISKSIKAPVKIVWINQTRMLRIFTPIDDEDLMIRYAETVIRRTFNTDMAMACYKK